MFSKRNRTSSWSIESGLYFATFLAYQPEVFPSFVLFEQGQKEAMLQSGNGFKSIILKRYYQREKGFQSYHETILKIWFLQYIWLWIAIEPENRQILALNISKERNMLIAERFISSLVQIHGNHPVSTDGGTWYPQACRFLNVYYHIHSSLEKSLIERTMQYIKDRTESFDDYFPCKLKNCKIKHVQNWLNLFAYQHNKI